MHVHRPPVPQDGRGLRYVEPVYCWYVAGMFFAAGVTPAQAATGPARR